MAVSPFHRAPRALISTLLAASVALTARASLADHYVVPSGSMEPTVQIGDRVLVEKIAYGLRLPLTDLYVARFQSPSRGDVVVLTSPQGGTVLLKRVVAIGGDRVQVRDGAVEINGRPAKLELDRGFLQEDIDGKTHLVNLGNAGGPDFGPVFVPKGDVLVLGDNRGDSLDGRMFGFVHESSIMGRAEGVFLRDGRPTWMPL
jgi:signal peptidase I